MLLGVPVAASQTLVLKQATMPALDSHRCEGPAQVLRLTQQDLTHCALSSDPIHFWTRFSMQPRVALNS